MILKKGDMWQRFGKVDLFLITTNPCIRKDGAIVMGRGIAKQMKDRFPAFPFEFGVQYASACELQGYEDALVPTQVGVVGYFSDHTGTQRCGWFMVKDHWKSAASLEIIEQSVRELIRLSGEWSVALNFPGIGNGRLRREDVLPIIEKLPDNVEVWEYE